MVILCIMHSGSLSGSLACSLLPQASLPGVPSGKLAHIVPYVMLGEKEGKKGKKLLYAPVLGSKKRRGSAPPSFLPLLALLALLPFFLACFITLFSTFFITFCLFITVLPTFFIALPCRSFGRESMLSLPEASLPGVRGSSPCLWVTGLSFFGGVYIYMIWYSMNLY